MRRALPAADVALMSCARACRERRAKDKGAILTAVMRKVEPGHRVRPVGDDCVVFLDDQTKQILSYDPLDRGKAHALISLEELSQHAVVQVRHDLMDTRIYICAPDVLALFTENFDYQQVGRDFIRGVIQSDILSNTLHAHITTDAYAAFVQSFRVYDAVSRDVILGWTAPMAPDTSLIADVNYSYRRGHIYIAQNVVLARYGRALSLASALILCWFFWFFFVAAPPSSAKMSLWARTRRLAATRSSSTASLARAAASATVSFSRTRTSLTALWSATAALCGTRLSARARSCERA